MRIFVKKDVAAEGTDHVEAVTPRGKGRDPTLPPNHPINSFSPAKKMGIVLSLAYAGMLCNFSAAIANVAFPEVGKSLHVSPGDIANALGYNLLGCAVGSLFWNPLSRSLGRRPVYLIGSLIFIPVCAWQALSNNYACFAIGRVVAGIVTSWTQTIPPASIADIYVPEVRGAKMSIFAVPTVLGPVIAPIFAAGIVRKHSWRNIFWFNLGLAGLQLLLMVFFVPETMWNWRDTPTVTVPGESDPASAHDLEKDEKPVVMQKEDVAIPTTPREGYVGPAFIPHKDWKRFWPLCRSPLYMFHYVVILVPSFYYGICLGFLSVCPTVVFPQIFVRPPYNFAIVPMGAAYLGFGVGGVLGLWAGGWASDIIVGIVAKRTGRRIPENRLWAGLPQLPLMFLGHLLMGLCVQLRLHWICFIIGGAISFFSLSAITTVILTYVLESYLSAAMDTQAVFNFWKFMWGFVVPFFTMQWGDTRGWIACFAGQGAILVGCGLLLLLGFLWKGEQLRKWQNMPEPHMES